MDFTEYTKQIGKQYELLGRYYEHREKFSEWEDSYKYWDEYIEKCKKQIEYMNKSVSDISEPPKPSMFSGFFSSSSKDKPFSDLTPYTRSQMADSEIEYILSSIETEKRYLVNCVNDIEKCNTVKSIDEKLSNFNTSIVLIDNLITDLKKHFNYRCDAYKEIYKQK